jgi:hypothetical protein
MNAPNVSNAPSAPSSKKCPRCGAALVAYDKLALLSGIVFLFIRSLAAVYIVGIVVAALLLLPSRCGQCGRIRLREFPAPVRTFIIIRKIFIVLLLVIILISADAVLEALRELNIK